MKDKIRRDGLSKMSMRTRYWYFLAVYSPCSLGPCQETRVSVPCYSNRSFSLNFEILQYITNGKQATGLGNLWYVQKQIIHRSSRSTYIGVLLVRFINQPSASTPPHPRDLRLLCLSLCIYSCRFFNVIQLIYLLEKILPFSTRGRTTRTETSAGRQGPKLASSDELY